MSAQDKFNDLLKRFGLGEPPSGAMDTVEDLARLARQAFCEATMVSNVKAMNQHYAQNKERTD